MAGRHILFAAGDEIPPVARPSPLIVAILASYKLKYPPPVAILRADQWTLLSCPWLLIGPLALIGHYLKIFCAARVPGPTPTLSSQRHS